MTRKTPSPETTEPYVKVTQRSRKVWTITLYDNSKGWIEGFAWEVAAWSRRTEAAATRKGIRELARYNRKYGSLSAGFTIQ